MDDARTVPDTDPTDDAKLRKRGVALVVAYFLIDGVMRAGDFHFGARAGLVPEPAAPPGRPGRLLGRQDAPHRSTIVNLDRVRALHPWSHGDLQIELEDGTELRLSRRYRDRLEAMFGP